MWKLLLLIVVIKLYARIFILEGATKLLPAITFVSATIIGENTINISNCCFSKQICSFSHQTKNLQIEN